MPDTRRKSGRQGINPLTSEVEYTDEELELLREIERWKKRTGRSFPGNCEVLAILKGLGYRKVEEKT